MDVQMTRPGISESGSLLPGEVRAEFAATDSAFGSQLDLDCTLGSDAAVTGGESGEVGRLDAQAHSEALLPAAWELLKIRGKVHSQLPSGAFTREFTNELYQVKVISPQGNAVSNTRMDVREIRKTRLRQLIDSQFGGIDAALAVKIGASASYVSRIFTDKVEHRRNIGESMARKIEQECGLEPGALDAPLEISVSPTLDVRPSTNYQLEPVTVWGDEDPLSEDEVSVPFLKEVELSAGPGRTAIAESTGRRLRFGKQTMRSQGIDPANVVAVLVTGTSMEPILPDGATAGVDRGATRVIDGKIYAIDHDGHLRVKQLYRLPSGGLRLRSFNRDEYEDEDYAADEVQRQKIQVIGRVFWGASFF